MTFNLQELTHIEKVERAFNSLIGDMSRITTALGLPLDRIDADRIIAEIARLTAAAKGGTQ